MPSLKRCKLGDSIGEDEDNSGTTRKKRKINYYYPLTLLGDVAAGIIPVSLHCIIATGEAEKGLAASWNTEVSYSPDEVESKSKGSDSSKAKNPTVEIARPPLVRTSRGRVQVLPSRFNDSVIKNWKKESKTSLHDHSLDDDDDDDDGFECKKDKFTFKTPKKCKQNVKNRRNKETNGYKGRKYTTLCEEDDREPGYDWPFGIRKYSSFRSSLTSVHEHLLEEHEKNANGVEIVDLTAKEQVPRENGEREDGLYGPEDLYSGDIVQARSGKREPCWPAIVIDPMTQAPSKGAKPCDFQLTMEEALLAEQGLTEKSIRDINIAAGNPAYDESVLSWGQEATGSNQDLDYHLPNQGLFGKCKDPRRCERCGMTLPFKMGKKMKGSTPGGTCARLTKSKHYFGICKKIWNHSDSGSWVWCDGCKVWVHAECDKISSHHFKDLGATDYNCPTCKAKFNFELSNSEKWEPKAKSKNNNGQLILPNKVTVVCCGVEVIYYPRLHSVVCQCGSPGSEKQALSEWERHAGSRERN